MPHFLKSDFDVQLLSVLLSVLIPTLSSLQRTCKGKVSSVSIPGLEEGQRYCVEVQYTLYNKTIGVPSCNHCALIPKSSKSPLLFVCLFVCWT